MGGGEGVMGRFKGKKTGLRGDKGREGKSGRTWKDGWMELRDTHTHTTQSM